MTAQILVVEDETIVAKDVQKRLKQMGYEVAGVAASGEEAVEKAMSLRPDLILMDIKLKGGMDGVEAAKAIHDRFDMPVVYITAYSDDTTLKRAEITQPFGYLLKPLDERELHVNIQMALYKHKIQRRLKESEQWFATALRCISDGVITTDEKGCVKFINPVATRLTGWSPLEAAGRDLAHVFRSIIEGTHTRIQSSVAKALQTGEVVRAATHTLLIAKDGTEVPIEENAAPIRNEEGKIIGAVLVFRDVTRRKEQSAAQEYQILHDILTGLPNRDMFYDRVQQAILMGHRTGKPLAILFLSLERFKEVNQQMGRYAGDLLLQQAGQRLWDSLRKMDTVARVGGGEFAILLPGAGQVERAVQIAQKVLTVMEEPFQLEGQSHKVEVCIGIVLFPAHGEDADTLMRYAHLAMTMARQAGQSYSIYGPAIEDKKKRRGRTLLGR